MQIEKIDELADVLHRSSLTRLEVEGDDWSLALERPAVAPRPAAQAESRKAVAFEEAESAGTPDLTYVESPIVGVFHEATPPIAVGQRVRAGEVLGSIEALALRNDVRSPTDGEVTTVQVEDGQPVEFGQALFVLGFPGDEP